ncbi:oxidase/peroxidase [Holotrichia oblita]|uniref:Oxidase/peroxidase n=1 Tax=Holotrichia oblita TaxID=644536 RepID=A0ACB9SNI3_HOLOL|nr:oxidase/peroxidase [Holotrichia oblita]
MFEATLATFKLYFKNRTYVLRTFLILLAGIKLTRLTKPHRNFSDNDTDHYIDDYVTRLTRTYRYDDSDHDFADHGLNITSTTKENPYNYTTYDYKQRNEKQQQHQKQQLLYDNNDEHLYPIDNASESVFNHREPPQDALTAESRIIHSGGIIWNSLHGGDKNYPKLGTTTGSGNFLSGKEVEDNQKVIDEAVKDGLKELHELYFIKEPLLYKMGTGNSLIVAEELNYFSRYSHNLGRQNLNIGDNLKTTLLNKQCPLRGVPRCALPSKRYRTADGTCNNIKEPWKGASMTPMQRFLTPIYEDGIQSPRLSIFNRNLPSSRKISTMIHRDKNRSVPTITLMFMQWGQFLDHDVTLTATSRAFNNSVPRCCLPGSTGLLPPEFMHPECMPIQVPRDDWFMGRFGMRCMEFIRSAPATRIDCDLGWREQINQVTSYIDGSMIYGSDVRKAESLRTFRGGLLQYGRRGSNNFPRDPPEGEICRTGAISTSCFLGGDSRFGEQPALTAMHTIWLRFHNQVAGVLQATNPQWSDEKLYQEARRIIGALIQHITYKEFLPVLLGPEVIELFGLSLKSKEYYTSYDQTINPATANSFSTAAFRFGHSLVQNSFVRSTINHQRLRNNVSIHDEHENPENIWSQGSLGRLILGLSNQPTQMRDEFIGDELTNHLFQSGEAPFGMDLAAINIQRGRDHGIPPYTSWRQPCSLSPINDWNDLSKVMRADTLKLFQSLYAHVDDIDLYSGGLAEKPVKGGMVGPVFACIIAQQFLNYRKGDRFWYENGDLESSFTPAQLQQIRKMTFAHIICSTINEIHNIQPFVFLASDDNENRRLRCENSGLNLEPWIEESNRINNDANDFSSDSGLNSFQQNNEDLVTGLFKRPTQSQPTFVHEADDFDFEKGFQETVNALNLINSENPIPIHQNVETIDLDDFGTESIEVSKIFSKRHAKNAEKPSFPPSNLILMRNLKNMKISEMINMELKKSPNIRSEITVSSKVNNPLKYKTINDSVLLLRRNQNTTTEMTIISNSDKENITDFLDEFRETGSTNDSMTVNKDSDILLLPKDLHIEATNETDFKTTNETENTTEQKLRNIDEYILDTLSDFYYDDDYDSQTKKNKNKQKKQTTKRPNQTREKHTTKSNLDVVTKTPDKLTTWTDELTNEDTDFEVYEDGKGSEFIVIHDGHKQSQGLYDGEDIRLDTLHTNLKYPEDIKKVHYADDYLDDPIMTNDHKGSNDDLPPNYQFNINIHVHPTMKPEVLTRRPLHPTYDNDQRLTQVSLLYNTNKTMIGHPLNINNHKQNHRIDYTNGQHEIIHGLTTKRPTTSYPIYVLNNAINKPTQKVTYVTGYMIQEPTTESTNMHVLSVHGPKRPSISYQTNRPLKLEPDSDINYSYLNQEYISNSPHRPIIILRPHELDATNTQNVYEVPIHIPPYMTLKPSKQTTREPQTLETRFPNNHYMYDHKKKNNLNKATSTSDNSKDQFYHIDDKLDFKTNLLPNRLKPYSNKNFVKISSVKVGYDHAKANIVENKEINNENEDKVENIVLPELEGIKVVQVDVLPSDDKYKITSFNDTEDSVPMPKMTKLYADDDCALELPKPMTVANKNTETSPAA